MISWRLQVQMCSDCSEVTSATGRRADRRDARRNVAVAFTTPTSSARAGARALPSTPTGTGRQVPKCCSEVLVHYIDLILYPGAQVKRALQTSGVPPRACCVFRHGSLCFGTVRSAPCESSSWRCRWELTARRFPAGWAPSWGTTGREGFPARGERSSRAAGAWRALPWGAVGLWRGGNRVWGRCLDWHFRFASVSNAGRLLWDVNAAAEFWTNRNPFVRHCRALCSQWAVAPLLAEPAWASPSGPSLALPLRLPKRIPTLLGGRAPRCEVALGGEEAGAWPYPSGPQPFRAETRPRGWRSCWRARAGTAARGPAAS